MEDKTSAADNISITLTHHGKPIVIPFAPDATVQHLSEHVSRVLGIPRENQKFLVAKMGLIKPPTLTGLDGQPLAQLADKKIQLLGNTAEEISSLNTKLSLNTLSSSAPRRRPIPAAAPARRRHFERMQEEVQYTFHTLLPLAHLPRPDRSLRFLERLRDDAGIRAAMRNHQFSVPLLTEMDPVEHTTLHSRTLGLNRNKGEVIELRLRTDAYDGYRDYKTIRNTLCHELAHCVWGPHDRNFWDLCGAIEKEVARNDWRTGGRSVGREPVYAPDPRDVHSGDDDGELVHDHGGWDGGEYTLGRTEGVTGGGEETGLSRREVLARAAEARTNKVKEVGKQAREAGG